MLLPLLASALAASPASGRVLTAGERSLLAPIYRDSVEYGAVRVVRGRAFPLQGRTTVVTIGRVIYAPAPIYLDDFSRGSELYRAILVHEIAHVWQHDAGIDVVAGAMRALVTTGGRYGRAYDYRLDPRRDLLDYGIEQQASILEHYFLAREGIRDRERFGAVLRRFLVDPRYPRALRGRWSPAPVRGRRAPP